MGHDEKDSVLDSDLKVRGIDALRVCDASAFPAQITGHPVRACHSMYPLLVLMNSIDCYCHRNGGKALLRDLGWNKGCRSCQCIVML